MENDKIPFSVKKKLFSLTEKKPNGENGSDAAAKVENPKGGGCTHSIATRWTTRFCFLGGYWASSGTAQPSNQE